PSSYPKKPGTCPACQHNDCFHELPKDHTKWFCFSTGHIDGVGLKVEGGGYYGDALDLEAHRRGLKPVDVLRADGYLTPPRQRPAARATGTDSAAPEPEPIPIRASQSTYRALRSRSYLTAVQILRENMRDVLEGRTL